MQRFLFFALFHSFWLAISQTKDLKIVCSLASIPQSNVKNYTLAKLLQTSARLCPLPISGGRIFKKFFYIKGHTEPSDKSKHKR